MHVVCMLELDGSVHSIHGPFYTSLKAEDWAAQHLADCEDYHHWIVRVVRPAS